MGNCEIYRLVFTAGARIGQAPAFSQTTAICNQPKENRMNKIHGQRSETAMNTTDQLAQASTDYYNGQPSMTDADFDAMQTRIGRLDIGAMPPAGRPKRRLASPMLSLDKVHSIEALARWHRMTAKKLGTDNISLTAEFKVDGIACQLIYRDGRLRSATTRGNGVIGTDIAEYICFSSACTVNSCASADEYVMNGELCVARDRLETINNWRQGQDLKPFACCRDAAIGLINTSAPKLSLLSGPPLLFVPWELVSNKTQSSQHDCLHVLRDFFQFRDSPFCCGDIEKVVNFIESVYQPKGIYGIGWRPPFDFDGVVVKVNDRDMQLQLGATKTYPKWAIAYKPAI
jgi:DNA ligase (NAD+)